IVKPAMDAMQRSAENLGLTARNLFNRFGDLQRIGSFLSRQWQYVLIRVATQLALLFARVSRGVETLGAGMLFLEEMATVGPIEAIRRLNATLALIEQKFNDTTAEIMALRDETWAAVGSTQ